MGKYKTYAINFLSEQSKYVSLVQCRCDVFGVMTFRKKTVVAVVSFLGCNSLVIKLLIMLKVTLVVVKMLIDVKQLSFSLD